MRTLLHALRPGGRAGGPRPRLRAAVDPVRAPGQLRRARARPPRLPGRRAGRKLSEAGFQVSPYQYTYGADRDVHQQHLLPDHRGRPAAQAAVRRGVPGAARGVLAREVLPAAVGRGRPGRGARPCRRRRQLAGAHGLRVTGRLIACACSSTSCTPRTSTSSATSTPRWRRAGTSCASPPGTRTARVELLRRVRPPYHQISEQKSGAVGLAVEMAQRTRRLMKVMR